MNVQIYISRKDEVFLRSYRMIRDVVADFSEKYKFKTLEIGVIAVPTGEEEKYRYYGHITVKINGEDIEERSDKEYRSESRTYSENGREVKHVPRNTFIAAVERYIEASIEAKKMKGDTSGPIC